MLNTNHLNPESEALAHRLSGDPDFRILRKLPAPFSAMPANGAPPDGTCVALLDVETTSLDPGTGTIIEIAIKLMWVSEGYEILGHLPIFSWLHDPGHPLDAEISILTGLRDEDLAGKQIDDEAVVRLLTRADLIIAHNATFDIAWVEKRWPQLGGLPWACSCVEVGWTALGFEGRNQQLLLQQEGWFSTAHRAAGDVWSLFCLLQQVRADPIKDEHNCADNQNRQIAPVLRTHLQRLLAASSRVGVKIEAVGAPFDRRHLLRQRGYRWDPDARRKLWWREVNSDDVDAELVWFRRNAIPAPRCVPITARERHR